MKFKKILASALAAVMAASSINIVNVFAAATGDDYINYIVGNKLNVLLDRSRENIDSLTIPDDTTLLRLDKGFSGIWANTREITKDDVLAVASFYDRSGNKVENPDFAFAPFALSIDPTDTHSAGLCQKVTTTGDKYAVMADFLVVNYNSYSYYIPFIASPANLKSADAMAEYSIMDVPQKPKSAYITQSGNPAYYLHGYQNGVKFADTYEDYKIYWDFFDVSEIYFLNSSEKSNFVNISDTETSGDFYSSSTDTDCDLYWIFTNSSTNACLYSKIESGTVNITTGDVFVHYVPITESSASDKTYAVKCYKPSGIKIAKQPDRTSYVAGESFDPTGMKVVLNCSDNTNSFEISNYTFDTAALTTDDTYVNVYAYINQVGNVFVKVPITVTAKAVETIEIVQNPDKLDYVDGEAFDLSGAEIKVTYNDGTSEIVDNRYVDITYASGNSLSTGDNHVIVSYGGKTADINVNVVEKQIISIKVVHQPDDINYVAGEAFDLKGIEVEATYNDGSTAIIEDYTYSPDMYIGSKVNDSLIGDVNRDGNIDKADAALVLRYAAGTTIDTPIDLVAADCNRDGNIDDIDSAWILRYKPGMAFINVSKAGKSDYFYVNVEDKTVISIKVTRKPNKTEYIDGQQFDQKGLVVEAVYNDGTSEIIEDYTIENKTVTKDMTNVHITYGNVYTTVPITVVSKEIVKLEVAHQPVKTEYVEGQKFDNTGLVIKATYTDGSTAIIDDYTVAPDELSVGDTVINISKDGISTTVPVTVIEKVVDHIEVTRLPDKLDYNEGEVFNPNGMEITAVYNDGSKAVITNYTYDNSPLTTGDTKVTVSYEGKTADVKIVLSLSDIDIKNLVPVKKGDVNRDGYVTPEDAAILIKYLNGVESDFNVHSVRTGDVDGDGVLTDSDVGLIRNYIKGNVSITDEVNADIDGDNEVTEYDAVLIDKAALGMWSLDTIYKDNADANDDGKINMLDVIWIINAHYRHTTVDGIEIVKAPDKSEYVEGQEFDPSGTQIKITNNDGTEKIYNADDITVKDNRPLTSDDTKVTVSVGGTEVEIPITVVERKPVKVEITENPDREYEEGDKYDPSGIKGEITYNDGTKEEFDADDITVKDDKPLTTDDTKVTIIVDGIETEVDVVVNPKITTTEATTETTTEATETTTKKSGSSGAGGGMHVVKTTTTEAATEYTTTEISTEAVTEATTDNRFTDVIDHWAEDYIEYLHKEGIVNGITEELFKPDISTKRGDFAIVLSRMLNLKKGYMTFDDVNSNSYYAQAIANCASANIFIGYGDGTFKPEQTISREEMMVVMAKLFAGSNYDFASLDNSVLDKFADGSNVSLWAVPYVSYLADNNVIVGDNGNIRPQDNITRAEMASIIYNYMPK